MTANPNINMDPNNESAHLYGGKGSRDDAYGSRGMQKLHTNPTQGKYERMGSQHSQTIDVDSRAVQLKKAGGLNSLSMHANQPANAYPMTVKGPAQLAADRSLENNLTQAFGNAGQARRTESQPKNTITARSTKLSGTKARKIPGGVRSVEVENIPSDISDDEWGEIQKFGQRLHEEQQRRVRAEHEKRKKDVREVLDQQVKLRAELREKNIKERQDFDKQILS